MITVEDADTVVSVRGIVRSAEGDAGQAGANIMATPVQPASQTVGHRSARAGIRRPSVVRAGRRTIPCERDGR